MYIHGVNVPHYDFSTWNRKISGEYDLLIGIYGFDSFTNMRYAAGSNIDINDEKILKKIKNQRYSMVENYGMYSMEALEEFCEIHKLSCSCPTCCAIKPLDWYNDALSDANHRYALKELRNKTKAHRQYCTHKECSELQEIIKKEKYPEYIKEKKEAKNEVNLIIQ